MGLRLPLLALGIVIHLPVALMFFGQFLMLTFEQSFFVGLAATAGSPLLLAAGLAKSSARVFVKTGRLLRIADWDCDPSIGGGWGLRVHRRNVLEREEIHPECQATVP